MALFNTILVATDLRERRQDLLEGAGAIAEFTGAKLHVLHSFDLSAQSYPDGTEASSFPGRVAQVERRLKEAVLAAVPPPVAVSTQTIIYSAHKAITAIAEDIAADLIILGGHRTRPFGDFLGSTADRVVRSASAPCLILRSALALPVRRFLIPTDLSEASESAIELGMRMGLSMGPGEGSSHPAELTVVHVLDRRLGLDEEFRNDVVIPQLQKTVQRVRGRVEGSEGLAVREEVSCGESAASDLLFRMKTSDYDLVVMGTHGYGAVSRALLGSVASSLTRIAPCSVLLVPPSAGFFHESPHGSSRAG